jgi:ABC-type uncharacterized transport system permease subunit
MVQESPFWSEEILSLQIGVIFGVILRLVLVDVIIWTGLSEQDMCFFSEKIVTILKWLLAIPTCK